MALQGDNFRTRNVNLKVLSVEQGEGRGARVRRSIGRPELRFFDPFLMLDEFKGSQPAGFPDHPHRGFETVSYLLPKSEGSFQHEDIVGNQGLLQAGDLQWMTAGRGIVHSEMPADTKTAHGLQLWVNLAAKDKMIPPSYQELKKAQIPIGVDNGVTARVIAGQALGITSRVMTRTPTMYIHFELAPNARLQQPIPREWNAFMYVLEGFGAFGEGEKVANSGPHHTLALARGDDFDGVTVTASESGVEFVLIAGQPLNEPVVQRGPFVMNTQAEIEQAFMDYHNGENGFEGADQWRSTIGRRAY